MCGGYYGEHIVSTCISSFTNIFFNWECVVSTLLFLMHATSGYKMISTIEEMKNELSMLDVDNEDIQESHLVKR